MSLFDNLGGHTKDRDREIGRVLLKMAAHHSDPGDDQAAEKDDSTRVDRKRLGQLLLLLPFNTSFARSTGKAINQKAELQRSINARAWSD